MGPSPTSPVSPKPPTLSHLLLQFTKLPRFLTGSLVSRLRSTLDTSCSLPDQLLCIPESCTSPTCRLAIPQAVGWASPHAAGLPTTKALVAFNVNTCATPVLKLVRSVRTKPCLSCPPLHFLCLPQFQNYNMGEKSFIWQIFRMQVPRDAGSSRSSLPFSHCMGIIQCLANIYGTFKQK